MLKVKELVELHNLLIHHVVIQLELKYVIAARAVVTIKLELRSGSNPAQTHHSMSSPYNNSPRQSASGFWKSMELNRTDFLVKSWTSGGVPGPVDNTTHSLVVAWSVSVIAVLVYALSQLPPAKLNGGGKKLIFPPQRPPSAS